MRQAFSRLELLTTLLTVALLSFGCASTAEQPEVHSLPPVKGQQDPALLAASRQVVGALDNVTELASLTSKDGLHVFPLFACKSTRLPQSQMTQSGADQSFTIDTCHEDDPDKMATRTWAGFLAETAASPALKMTQRITLDTRDGIGIDTGTSYLAETRFPASGYKIAAYLFLGTEAQNYRNWEEVGFVFDASQPQLSLVAIYRDSFSSI